MKSSPWLSDTVARRFAVTEVLAVAVTLALVGLFRTFGGVWSNEPLERSSLLNEAADIVRVVEAAPPSMRQTLAAAAAPAEFRINWYAAASRASASLDSLSARAPPRFPAKRSNAILPGFSSRAARPIFRR